MYEGDSTVTDIIMILIYKLREKVVNLGLNSVVLYAHNLSSFDGYFILTSLGEAGINVDILKRDSEIFYIKTRINGVEFEFRCSLLLLRQDLNSCANSFDVSLNKLDHDWVTRDRLFHEGETPFSGGNKIIFKDYVTEYCLRDCIILFEVLKVFNSKIKEYGVGLHMKVYSIPGLAFKAFKKAFVQADTTYNLSTRKGIERFMREAYYGGRIEVFMGYIGDNKGYYYDVKGMYAEAMKKDLPCGAFALSLGGIEPPACRGAHRGPPV